VKYLILDEIHAVLGNKRGAFLSCQIDRLALLAGEFQRISLSATVRSPETAAAFIGGIGPGGKARTVSIVTPEPEKRIELTIEYPDVDNDDVNNNIGQIDKYGKRYSGLINYILNKISAQSTILVFTDSRRRAERLAFFLNQEAASRNMTANGPVAFAHHGSLSKELRRGVEQRLARGELPCVVATASLELGIDIGSVDEVALAGSPGIVSQALQRIGRSGHGVGMVSRGRLFPFHGMDLLLATALKSAVDDRDIEEISPIENPLDILAQIILALCVERNRNIEELYTTLRGFYVFKNLNYESYMRTVRMLAGMGEKGRLREIKPRIWLDALTGEIGALEGSLLLLYGSGGVIANRGLYSLRIADGTKIGELDEEFVWERRIRDRFHFGGRGWQITAIGTESVEVTPLSIPADFIPFWHADTSFRSPRLTKRVLAILDRGVGSGDRRTGALRGCPPLRGEAEARGAEAGGGPPPLITFLDSQREAQGDVPLSGGANITVEIIDSPEMQGDFYTAVIHSFRGGAVNYPLALALAQELEETLGLRVESFSNDDAILLLIPRQGQAEELIRRALMSLNDSDTGGISRGERLFRNRLEISGVFGANFREAAERSLLLPRAGFGKRTPLWITRQRSKRLFDAVSAEDGFPVTAEAWRSCLNDMFDMEGFRDLIISLNDGSVALSFFRSSTPSPFSRDLVRQETNSLMYEYDERQDGQAGGRSATLSDKVIEEALGSASLRPALPQELVDSFTARLRRELSGWAPEDELSLCEWVKERIAVPLDEWESLCTILPRALRQELFTEAGALQSYSRYFFRGPGSAGDHDRLIMIKRNDTSVASVVHREWKSAWENEALTLLGPWLRYEGPVSLERIAEVFGVTANVAEQAVNALAEVEEVTRDVTVEMSDELPIFDPHFPISIPQSPAVSRQSSLICDRENLEMLLRLSRRKARPTIKERPAALLIPFLALRQGLAGETRHTDAALLKIIAERLAGWPAPAKLWETEFCAARCNAYNGEIIDRGIREGRLVWYGRGKERIALCRPEDLDLVCTNKTTEYTELHGGKEKTDIKNSVKLRGNKNLKSTHITEAVSSGFFDRPRDFWEIKEAMATEAPVTSRACAEAIWREVWKGRLSADSLEPVRCGIENGFNLKDGDIADNAAGLPASGFGGSPRFPRVPRALRNRWKGGAPVRGEWFSLAIDNLPEAADPFDEECRNRDRVRLLLARWGILCRALLEREAAPFTWSGLLPTMRRMELSGELAAGRFFAGINSLQFASPAIVRELENAESFNGLYWMNAVDPASPSGLDIEGFDDRIPGRLLSSRLYFRGEALIAVTNKNGKDQRIFIAPDDPDLAALIELFKIPRTRKVFPENKILVEHINDGEAALCEYAPAFRSAGFVADRGKLCFW
jgi:ATP-dependent Lhr-like helicase